jgi:diguanylate cyclase (GGDEF)-like protein
MRSLISTSLGRNVAALIVALAVLIGGTWTAVRVTTNYLLHQNATSTARNWAEYLATNVVDLEQIAGGEMPSTASMVFFESARKANQVFRYEIFNRQGYSQLVSDRDEIALVDLSEYSAEAARSIEAGETVVDTGEGEALDWPSFFARAYIPALVNGEPVAIVAAYVDQTEQRDRFQNAFLIAALSLCLLTGLSFTIPSVAWYRRTREKQQADRRITFLAHHDSLTGLTNRMRLIEKLDRALAAVAVRGGGFAVHFIDLDHFKEINDTLGHDGGDFLLKTVADRLRSSARIDDEVARLGGDEFVVVQSAVTTRDQAREFARRMTAEIAMPMQFGGQHIRTTASVGVALAPEDGSTSERILKSADLALYKSKADGRNCVMFFMPEMDAELKARLDLEKAIREAVAQDRFELHYQPLFQMADRRLIGFEALVRLPKEDGTLIEPLVFIPVAEEMRLIDRIGEWVLREACRTATTWPGDLTVAVNLSPSQFHAGGVAKTVAAALKESGLAPNRLELEITETLLLGDSEATLAELKMLKDMGVAIVMDDFGTGYSSLSYLWRFPFDKIKIDRSFMQGLDGTGRDAKTVVKTIIALGRELDMQVTVEGVETAKQAAFLDTASGDQAQGFFFGKPIPANEIAAGILANFRETTTAAAAATEEKGRTRRAG